MKLHKEGFFTIAVAFTVLFSLAAILMYSMPSVLWIQIVVVVLPLAFFLRITHFFRVPKRQFTALKDTILSPADGKIVAIEEVFEEEFLKQKCTQVSVFMSPRDVHINWIPASGEVTYYKYHPGKHLVAWHPKSSYLNERTSVGLKLENEAIILVRQIAGALARRIVCYAKEGKHMNQTEELGFIKFGSRVDVFLPLESTIHVKLNDAVVGGKTSIAQLN